MGSQLEEAVIRRDEEAIEQALQYFARGIA
jgi:hypothetical protein